MQQIHAQHADARRTAAQEGFEPREQVLERRLQHGDVLCGGQLASLVEALGHDEAPARRGAPAESLVELVEEPRSEARGEACARQP